LGEHHCYFYTACTLLFNLQLSFVLVFFVSSIVTSFVCSLYQWDVVFILKKNKIRCGFSLWSWYPFFLEFVQFVISGLICGG
jgi:hypothetical protein